MRTAANTDQQLTAIARRAAIFQRPLRSEHDRPASVERNSFGDDYIRRDAERRRQYVRDIQEHETARRMKRTAVLLALSAIVMLTVLATASLAFVVLS